ncbi:helix-turn-helix domain-containing protein [Sandarakinorhabdus sp. AAP62]|uniref:AraC family transcriptional regulator n=1 Tax=Sandarakinorhabdus sp. AAP62 TaxID=1248916 RepID=UPI00031590BA|nr:helix-turn-helix domain-containing protein [Sandarakinorhabdus sp. AAP62]
MFSAGDDQKRNVLPAVHFVLPAAQLRPLITTYYGVTTPVALEDHLHPEWGNIRFTLRGDWTMERPGCTDPTPRHTALFGPTDRTGIVRSAGPGSVVGVGLTALGWAVLVDRSAHDHANRMHELTDIYGAQAESLWAALCATDWEGCCALLDAFFSERAAAAPPPDPLIERVQQALVSGNIDTVPDFAGGLAMTERTLARLCHRAFGFSPKQLLRRQRFLRTLAQIGDRLDLPLSTLLDGGYYDQSHFIREFKAYMGMTPLAYFNSPRQMMRRAGAERLRTAGARVQGLHQPG